MTGSYPVGYRTLQYGHGASARPQKVFYHREMAVAAEDIYDWGGPKHKDDYIHETA